MAVKVSFDELLAEAQREPVEIEMPTGKPIVVEFPTGDRAKLIQAAMKAGDEDAGMVALFGEPEAKRLIAKFGDAPADLPGRLVKKVMESFGVPPDLLG